MRSRTVKLFTLIMVVVMSQLLTACSLSEYADIGKDFTKTLQKDIQGIVKEVDDSDFESLLKKLGVTETEESGPTDYIQLYKYVTGMNVTEVAACLNGTHTSNSVVALSYKDNYYTFGNLTTSDGTPYVAELNDTLRDSDGNPLLFMDNYINPKEFAGDIQTSIYDTKEFPKVVVDIVGGLDKEGYFAKRNIYDCNNNLVGFLIFID